MSVIKGVLVGTTASGKSSIRKCFNLAARGRKNARGQSPPSLALMYQLAANIKDEVLGNEEDEEDVGTLIVGGRPRRFRLIDFKGGNCDTFLENTSGEALPKDVKEKLDGARLMVFVVSRDKLGTDDLLNKFQVLGNRALQEAADRGEPPPMLALAVSKSDDTGLPPPADYRDHRILRTTSERKLVRKLGKPAAWMDFLGAVAPADRDAPTRDLIVRTKEFWEKLGPNAPALNGYVVAATPEDPRWEGWEHRGVLQMAADFYDYVGRTTPRYERTTRWVGAAACLLVGTVAIVAGENERRNAADCVAVAALFGDDTGRENATPTRYFEQAASIGPRTAFFGTDSPARQLVLRRVSARYDKLAGILNGAALLEFDEARSEAEVLTLREERATTRDPVVKTAWEEYKATLAGLAARGKQLRDFREQFSKKSDLARLDARKYLDELRQIASDMNGFLEDPKRRAVKVRTGRGEEELPAALRRAVQDALDAVMLETYKPAFVAALRDQADDEPLILLGEKYNPYTARGLTNLGLRPPAGFTFDVSSRQVHGTLVCRDRFGAKVEIDLWHRTVSTVDGPPVPLTGESIPGDAVLLEYRWSGGVVTAAYQSRPENLLLAALIASVRGDGFDPAVRIAPNDPPAREQLRAGLTCLAFPRPDEQNPFAASDALTRILIDGVRAEKEQLRSDLHAEQARAVAAKERAVGLMVEGVLSGLERETAARIPIDILGAVGKSTEALTLTLDEACRKYLSSKVPPADGLHASARHLTERYIECQGARARWQATPAPLANEIPNLAINPGDWGQVERQIDLAVRLELANRRYARYTSEFEINNIVPQVPNWLERVKGHQKAQTIEARATALRDTATTNSKLNGELYWVVADAMSIASEYQQVATQHAKALGAWAELEPVGSIVPGGQREWPVKLPKGYDKIARVILEPPLPGPVSFNSPKVLPNGKAANGLPGPGLQRDFGK